MALVSPSVPIHLRTHMRPIHSFSRTPSVRSSGSGGSGSSGLREIEEEVEEEVVEAKEEEEEKEEEGEVEKIYVALAKEYKEGKETLIWVLQNICRDKEIVIVYVHRPPQTISIMGGKFPVSQLKEQQVRAYRQREIRKVNERLEEYLPLCSHAKVRAKTLVIENDDVGVGLVQLIAQRRITTLVMGAAADKKYSTKMKAPKAKTAITVQQQADPSCMIWFICRGNKICTRGTVQDGSMMSRSPTDSLSFRSGHVSELRSKSLHQHQTQPTNWLASPILRSKSYISNSHEGRDITQVSPKTPTRTSSSSSLSTDESINDPSEDMPRSSSRSSEHSAFKDEEIEPEEDQHSSAPTTEPEDNEMNSDINEKLQHVLMEAENLKRKAHEESSRRQKAERDAIEADRKAKASQNLYVKALKQRKETEATLAREKIELEQLKNQRDEIMGELQKSRMQKLELEQQVSYSDQIVKDFEEKLSEAKCLLSSLQKEYEAVQQERDHVVREAETLRQKKEAATTSTDWAVNFSEFSYEDLMRATNNFDDALKIGEGGYGSVYKGSLRCTSVAIKMLNPQSMQGQAEFYQEMEILSKVRHPHLITLIGTCPEAWALIYEYLPNGSLEDRLFCRGNTAPLPWQVRTRIAAEICSALIFLHSTKPQTIVHGDLKPANILLDANLVSKLGDFGICRLLIQSNTTRTPYCHTNPKGTFAYMDPEFLASGELTPRSDVYSFGVIILRLLTGRRETLGIIKEVQEAMEGGRLHEILDVSAGDWPFVQAKQLAHLALRCCNLKRKNRPDLAEDVWRVLEPMMKAASYVGSASLPSGSSCLAERRCIPSYFMCPIFQEIMRDPHIAADGFTYEAEALKGWLDSGHETSPMTNVKLSHKELIPNRTLRSAIQEWLLHQQ